MPEINIRGAKITDAPQIANIHVLSWQKVYRGHLPDRALDNLSIKTREAQWIALIKNGVIVLVVEKNNQIIGFASLCAVRDDALDKQRCGEISAIYLAPHVWRQGVGRKLCNAACNKLQEKGFNEVIVWVLKENRQAKNFYEAMGFKNTGKLKTESYDKNVVFSEVCYQKQLEPPVEFKPLAEEDLDLLCQWLEKPHVKEWWNDHLTLHETKEKYRQRIGDTVVVPFIICYNHIPIGFIQYYQANQVGEGWWPDEMEGTIGIDQFIGEEYFINRGIGTKVIQEFVKYLLLNKGIKKIITDVDPRNKRAMRCYEKCGFKLIKKIMTPDGEAYLMEMLR